MEFTPAFWEGLVKIVFVNILLSGDNAVVIALASRSLPQQLRSRAIWFGAIGAVLLRLVFSLFIVQLMAISYLKIAGAILLLWIGVKMIVPEHSGDETGEDDQNNAGSGIWSAVKTIIVADAVMSLDNVIAIAAAANGNFTLIAIGLAMSVPLIIYGSTLILHFLIRYPVLVMFGAGLIGWIAGEIWISDPSVMGWTHEIVETYGHWLEWASAAAGAILVVAVGKIVAMRAEARSRDKRAVDLAAGETK